ncbi:hypothetical protein [Nonomuraea soli]|uniref:Uncharacterized protein n=1 Tax=Nonomuraea soli TaxID=1032476 RepID=A0A7W0CUV7_9ACTN|nr:hypothetical protein [Nonomuraea soli]MBA2897778.1 hypothetical protein [Nonomuraea soli]
MSGRDLGFVAEALFDRYLAERGYTAHASDDPGQRNPDRLITVPDGRRAVCEVKSFASKGLLKRAHFREGEAGTGMRVSQPMVQSQKEALEPVRDKIKEAAKQLRRYKDDGLPLMVVLANPMSKPIPFDESSLIAAMYGDIEAVFEIPEQGAEGEGESWLAAGLNGKLTNDHQYISAVALLRERPHSIAWAAAWFDENRSRFEDPKDMAVGYLEAAVTEDVPQGSDVFLSIIETASEEAVPLPRDLFNGPLDLRYSLLLDGSGFGLLDDHTTH